MGSRGPKPVKLDWDQVIKLIAHQHTQKDVADFFDISVDTLERACLREQGVKLAEFFAKKESLGRIKLRRLQFQIIEKGGNGAAPLAIYLDKRFFGDPERPITHGTSNQVGKIEIKSFEEFCVDAGYPAPYPKQVEMMNFALKENDPRLLLGARGYGKTDYVTILGIAYWIYLDPTFTAVIMTKSRSRNTAIVEEISNALKMNGVVLEKENSTTIRVHGLKGKEHSVEAITIKMSFRGRHPKLILMDDVVTEDDDSEAMRILVKKKYNEAYKLCKNIVIVGQPAHAFDLFADLRPILLKMEVPWGSIIELDVDLKAMALAGIDPASIEMSYHLRIPKEGSSIFSELKFIEKMPSGDKVAFIDPSDGGDYTAISIVKAYMDGVAVYGKAYKKAWYHCIDEIIPVLVQLGVKRVAFETNATGNQPIGQLQVAFQKFGIGVVGIFSTTNKHSTILTAGMYANAIHLSHESDKVYTDQVVRYTAKSKHDDAPDSLARCLEWLGLIRGKK